MKTRKNIRDLWAGCLDSKPVNYDWSANSYAEAWEFWEASNNPGEDGEPVIRSWENESGHQFDGPMMNYYYPFPGRINPADLAESIKDLPLCVVRIEDADTYGLALTGGGMDLSWEICEAFMLCGYLPPVHFCDLPQVAGRGTSPRDRWIIAGCRRSLQLQKNQAGRALRRLRENFKEVRA